MLGKIIKAYDIRGLVDKEVTPDFSFALGVAFARFLEIEREPATIVVGEDMRPSSPLLADAFQMVRTVKVWMSSESDWHLPICCTLHLAN